MHSTGNLREATTFFHRLRPPNNRESTPDIHRKYLTIFLLNGNLLQTIIRTSLEKNRISLTEETACSGTRTQRVTTFIYLPYRNNIRTKVYILRIEGRRYFI